MGSFAFHLYFCIEFRFSPMKRLLYIVSFLILFSCSSDDSQSPVQKDNFNRREMLTAIADDVIVPNLNQFSKDLTDLNEVWSSYKTTSSQANFTELTAAYKKALLSYQGVEFLNIGKAEDLDFPYYMNSYPVNKTKIKQNIQSGDFKFDVISSRSEQGLQALDYLFFDVIQSNEFGPSENTKAYVDAVFTRLNSLTEQVKTDWSGSAKLNFISNDGSNVNASVDQITNDLIFYYEKFLRAGKVGIPAGVFSNSKLPTHVEALYLKNYNKELLVEAVKNFKLIFNQKNTYASYLDDLGTKKDDVLLSKAINDQLDLALEAIQKLDGELSTQVETDNTKMTEAFDALQKVVVLLKVDMTQAMNITIDYVDADGD